MKILMYNMSRFDDWQSGVKNRNGKMLQHLLKRPEIEQVVCVDFLPFSFKSFLSALKQRIFHKHKDVLRRSLSFQIYRPEASDFFPDTSKILVYSGFTDNPLKKNLEIVNFTPDIVWSYTPFSFFSIQRYQEATKVFSAVDDWTYHPVYSRYRDRLERIYKEIDKHADVIFTVSKSLVAKFSNSHTYWIPNGIDMDFFRNAKQYDPSSFLPKDALAFLEKKRKVIGYVGTVESRVDLKLLKYCAKQHEDKAFIVAGPVWKDAQQHINTLFSDTKNVFFVGRVPYTQLPSLLNLYDVGIIPHKMNDFIKSMDPLKLYDYLAVGLPVVSTPSESVSRFSDMIYIANDADEFSRDIEKSIKEDTKEKRANRIEYMYNHTWDKRIDRIMDKLKKK